MLFSWRIKLSSWRIRDIWSILNQIKIESKSIYINLELNIYLKSINVRNESLWTKRISLFGCTQTMTVDPQQSHQTIRLIVDFRNASCIWSKVKCERCLAWTKIAYRLNFFTCIFCLQILGEVYHGHSCFFFSI